MLDRERILGRLATLEGYLQELQTIAPESFEAFRKIEKKRACERILQISIEAVIDLDLLIVVERSEQPFERRSLGWDTTPLPVPTDLLVYTKEEWGSLNREGRFYQTLMREAVWVYGREQTDPPIF